MKLMAQATRRPTLWLGMAELSGRVWTTFWVMSEGIWMAVTGLKSYRI